MDYKFNENEQIKCPICGESANYREFPDVVRLLQPGEAYREMWGWLDNMVNANGMCYNLKWKKEVGDIMYDLEQKYFPKNEATNEKG